MGVASLVLSKDETVVIWQRRNWQAASPFATHDRDGRPYRSRAGGLDPGIAPFVKLLYDQGVETYESCQGGPDPTRPDRGHAYAEPTIAFHGGLEAGPRAFAIARAYGLPVAEVRRVWRIDDGELTGPTWNMTFTRMATDDDRRRLGQIPDPRRHRHPDRRGTRRV